MFIRRLVKLKPNFCWVWLSFCFALGTECKDLRVVIPNNLVVLSELFNDSDMRVLSESSYPKAHMMQCANSPCLDLSLHSGSVWLDTKRNFERSLLYGFRLKLWLTDDYSEDEVSILYSSHFLPGHFSLHRVSVKALPKNLIVELDVWLPELARFEENGWVLLLGPSDVFRNHLPIAYRSENYLNHPGIRVLGLEWLKPIAEDPHKIFEQGRKMWPSLMDQTFSQGLLALILSLFLIRLWVFWNKRIGMKVQFFLILPTLILVFGMFRSFDRAELEQLEVSGLEQELILESAWWNSHRMAMDELFFQEIERFIRECKHYMDKLTEVGFSLGDYRKFEKNSVHIQLVQKIFEDLGVSKTLYSQQNRNQHPLELFLVGTYFSRDVRYTIANSETSFCLDESDCFLNRMLVSLFQRSISLEVARGLLGLNPAEAETNAGVYRDLRELVTQAIQDTWIMDGFMNNPAKLYSLFPSDSKYLASRGLNFWYWFEHQEQNWTILGEISERNYIKAFFDLLQTKYSDRIKDAWVQAKLVMPNFPLENGTISEMSRQAALNQMVAVPGFSLVWEGDRPYLYYRNRLDLFESYTLVLRRDASSVFMNAQTYGNRVYLWLLFVLSGLFLISVLITKRVEFSARQLLDGLIRIRRGDLNFFISVSGGDQFARLSDGFNGFVEKLREKELIGLLLNSMAVNSLKSQRTESIRQEATVLFVSSKKTLEDMAFLLNLLDETVHRNQGFLDKFTGSSFLAIFPGRENRSSALVCARELKEALGKKTCGIGIACGEVITGHVGSEGRKDFTAIGSTVNLAARLQALAAGHDGTRIFTLAEYANDFGLPVQSIKIMDDLKIRGSFKNVRVCEVLD